jgi:branched-chain amino acid aminotransferase
MADSAARISMPAPDPEQLLELIKALCQVEGLRWLPCDTSRGKYLYVRPTMIAVDADLECKVPREVLLYVVITYWPSAPESTPTPGAWKRPKGLKLWASPEESIRAWPGGSGNKKVAANYAPALKSHKEAQQQGFDQVLWLYGKEGLVTEAGGTNFFVIWKSTGGKIQLNTAPLDSGLILPGITRKSILSLARTRFAETGQWELDGQSVCTEPLDVTEKDFTVHDIIHASDDGRLLAAFAVGTAYFVKEVVEINVRGRSLNISADAVPHPALLRKWLSDIMYGAEENNWAEVLEG